MRCQKCHTKLKESAKFCHSCGSDVKDTKEKGNSNKRWLTFTFLGAFLITIIGGTTFLIIKDLSKDTTVNTIDENNENINETADEDTEELMGEFSFYEGLISKDEMQNFVDDFYEKEDPDNTRTDLANLRSTLDESIEEKYGERNLDAYNKGLFIDEDMSLEDKKQVLINLREIQDAQSAKVIINPVDQPQNELENENRYRAIDELDNHDAFIGEDTFFVDTDGFIDSNSGGLNLGYPLFGSYFDESDEYLRSVEFVVYHYVDEDIPLEAESMLEFFEKITEIDVQINGNDVYDYVMSEINEDRLDLEELEEQIEYFNDNIDYDENYFLLKDSIYALSIDVPLDIIVDVPPRQFPIDGEMRQIFGEQIEDGSVVVTINGQEFTVNIAGPSVNETYINPEVK